MGTTDRMAGAAVSPRERRADSRADLIAHLGAAVVQFQDGANDFDDAAGAVLALGRMELRCLSVLLFQGAASAEVLRQRLRLSRGQVSAIRERLLLAGYAREAHVGGSIRLELTEHARQWVGALWGPLAEASHALLSREPTANLRVLARFMTGVLSAQDVHLARLRALLESPGARAPANRSRGGLSPAALRRVQLFVEANLSRPIRLAELAERAGLSTFHFARAFRTSMALTPRAFVEELRVQRAQQLLRTTRLPLAQVAAEVGLGTQSRFTTVFRKRTGLTPAAFRRGLR